MTVYAIGDLHGCLSPLQRLLDKISFEPSTDKLWFVGDIVNRGPQSLETLRFVKAFGDSAITVLGNHDLHLLAVMHGVRKPSSKDTLKHILKCYDREELAQWIRNKKLLHHDQQHGVTMVHAGIHPHWTLEVARQEASRIEETLRQDDYVGFLSEMYGNLPAQWSAELNGIKRLRFAVNVLTRMRYCRSNGALDFSFNAAPKEAATDILPWYQVTRKFPLTDPVIFGHWSAHPAMAPPGYIPIDRGCVWDGSLVAFDVTGRFSWSVPNKCG
ncbi:MAG: symmetrical bis(5'-nucleosyl)-tetraphosphatase [Gammaproteobacteria bacterium]|nr:symmetrical bis(5'-nucleosyl)-tetraphosphatase [Gammaproteobacteria bacterium]